MLWPKLGLAKSRSVLHLLGKIYLGKKSLLRSNRGSRLCICSGLSVILDTSQTWALDQVAVVSRRLLRLHGGNPAENRAVWTPQAQGRVSSTQTTFAFVSPSLQRDTSSCETRVQRPGWSHPFKEMLIQTLQGSLFLHTFSVHLSRQS